MAQNSQLTYGLAGNGTLPGKTVEELLDKFFPKDADISIGWFLYPPQPENAALSAAVAWTQAEFNTRAEKRVLPAEGGDLIASLLKARAEDGDDLKLLMVGWNQENPVPADADLVRRAQAEGIECIELASGFHPITLPEPELEAKPEPEPAAVVKAAPSATRLPCGVDYLQLGRDIAAAIQEPGSDLGHLLYGLFVGTTMSVVDHALEARGLGGSGEVTMPSGDGDIIRGAAKNVPGYFAPLFKAAADSLDRDPAWETPTAGRDTVTVFVVSADDGKYMEFPRHGQRRKDLPTAELTREDFDRLKTEGKIAEYEPVNPRREKAGARKGSGSRT